jgi:hypothetical protein
MEQFKKKYEAWIIMWILAWNFISRYFSENNLNFYDFKFKKINKNANVIDLCRIRTYGFMKNFTFTIPFMGLPIPFTYEFNEKV